MASGPRPSFVETDDGASLFYVDWGAGKPVLFTHAWGLNADIWEYQLTELVDQGLRCIAYDRRGHGRSTDPGRGYDYDRLADDLAALINQLDLNDVTLVGFSMGNGEAVRYLQRHGSARIARLVMVSTIPPQSESSRFNAMIAGLKQDRPALFASGVTAFTGGHAAVSPADGPVGDRAVHAGLAERRHRVHARDFARRSPRRHARRHLADVDRPRRQGSGQSAGKNREEGR
jgi:pimeloyl-ACP methyl ester carboxylesterase